ncbi:MAG: hypothetical protein P8129_23660 [Anaerolineae bacterium]
MALSGMSSKEKTIVAVLAVVIVLALVGIGILAAQLIGDNNEEGGSVAVATSTSGAATVAATPGGGEEGTEATPGAEGGGSGVTPVDTPALAQGQDVPPPVEGDEPVAVGQAESVGPLAPAILVDQPLYAHHLYEIEIKTADGSQLAIEGSWSQAATSSSGEVVAPQVEFFEGLTPYTIALQAPVADPAKWGCSARASLKESLGQTTHVVITVWDVTGVE